MPRNETATERARRLRREATLAESALMAATAAAPGRRREVSPAALPADDLYADFCCIEERLVVEVDGVHHAQPSYEEADERRTQRLRAESYEVIRFSNAEVVGDPDRVVHDIAKTIDEQRIRHPYRLPPISGR